MHSITAGFNPCDWTNGKRKSISLYTALQWLNTPDKHIMTAEGSRWELELEGIIQTRVNPQIGLDFSRLLRTFYDKDPDIIMATKFEDGSSALMALRAAQTGHLVLSTLHTTRCHFQQFPRLQQLGIQSPTN